MPEILNIETRGRTCNYYQTNAMPNPAHQAQNPEITQLPATASPKEVADEIRRDGGVIIKHFIIPKVVAKIDGEIAPHWQRKGEYQGICSTQMIPH